MKRTWEIHELIESWTLLPRELEFLHNKSGSTRLGYAVNLKFFQNEVKFPETKGDVPKTILKYMAQQVNVESEEFRHYDLHSRSAKYHRQQIREFCGVRQPTIQDANQLKDWLLQTILPKTLEIQFLENAANQRLRELGIEAISLGRLHRVIHAALHTYEQQFCQDISDKLSKETHRGIDQLLSFSEPQENDVQSDSEPQSKMPMFNFLGSDPGGASLDHLFQEIEKLKLLRQLDLPLNLFQGVSPKIVTTY